MPSWSRATNGCGSAERATEYGAIAREIHIGATPDVVYEVITKPEHIAQGWDFAASFPAVPGGDGRMSKQRQDGTGTLVVPIHVIEVDAPRRFVFRWVHPEDQAARRRTRPS